jgi:pantoate--beta-alanine ligase
VASLRHRVAAARRAGQTIGLVPTMGALHDGHLSLVQRSVNTCDYTVVTIFVNPTQFGPNEDFARYPRTLESDLTLLARHRADLVFTPGTKTIYPAGCTTTVEPPAVAQPLEGQCRPGHFRGVATVVLKLFHLVGADVAFFGQKDFQQARVIEQMVRDLHVPVSIHVCPIVREPDGLAMSSRNRYLSAEQRKQSLSLYRALKRAVDLASRGERQAQVVRDQMLAELTGGGVTDVDYATIVDPITLQEVEEVKVESVALVAARVGDTRLIDNCRLGEGL